MITYTNELNMTPGGDKVEINLNQNDEDFALVFILTSSRGTLTIEDGTTAKIRGRKGAGGSYEASATLDVPNKKVTVAGDGDLTNEPGGGKFEIELTHDGKTLSSSNFNIVIEKSPALTSS